MLEKEAGMTEYFHSKGIGAEVLHYISDDRDWLLTSTVTGEDCLHEGYLMDPKRLCDTMAYELRKLHETDYAGCPVADRHTHMEGIGQTSLSLKSLLRLKSLGEQARKFLPN